MGTRAAKSADCNVVVVTTKMSEKAFDMIFVLVCISSK